MQYIFRQNKTRFLDILVVIALTLIALLVAGEECEVVVGTSVGSK